MLARYSSNTSEKRNTTKIYGKDINMNNLDFNQFKQIISDYVGVDSSEINEETDVYEDLYLDSLGLFGLGSEITETLRLNIPLSSVASISRVGEMFNLLNREGTPLE